MEDEIDDSVSQCLAMVNEYTDKLEQERDRQRDIIESIHKFIHCSAQHEVIAGYRDKMAEVEESIDMRCDEFQLLTYLTLTPKAGNSSCYTVLSYNLLDFSLSPVEELS